METTPTNEQPAQTRKKEEPKRKYTPTERLLLPAALFIAFLFDRLSPAAGITSSDGLLIRWGIFWLCYMVILYAFYWKRLCRNRVLWIVAFFSAALCLWGVFFNADCAYGGLTFLVIPAVLMAHAQYLAGDYGLKDAGKMAVAWLGGWLVKPFSAIPMLVGAAGSLAADGNKPALKKTVLGVLITLPLMMIILPLLSGADQVFGHYLSRIFGSVDAGSIFGHSILVIIVFFLFYSFLWNIGFGEKNQIATNRGYEADKIISCIVLGAVSLLYLVFCAVQFTYLFAGAGLPEGITYSDYAREGFAQTIAVCAINLVLYGVFLQYGKRDKVLSVLLTGLLAMTMVMLVSGALRLGLYIDAYGLTWLRLLSGWFIIYLAVVIILCAVRMFKEKLPIVGVCAIILLGWYAALGYANPEGLIL